MRRPICLTILVLSTLSSSVGHADVSLSLSDVADAGPALARQPREWQRPPNMNEAAAPSRWQPPYPLLTAPQLTAWLLRADGSPTFVPALASLHAHERALTADDASAGLGGSTNLRASWPMLRYRDADGDLSLTLSPGSPCTGACLKVAGSF